MLKIANHAQALELIAHDADVLGGKLLADLAQFQLGDVLFLVPQRGKGLQFDGQAVGIEAGHIRGLEAVHVLLADDDILDDLVQRCTHMDAAVGVRRAVVQHKAGLALVMLHQLVVQVVLVPVLQHDGLFLGQAGTHFKQGLGQMQGTVVLGFCLRHWFHTPQNSFFLRTPGAVGRKRPAQRNSGGFWRPAPAAPAKAARCVRAAGSNAAVLFTC